MKQTKREIPGQLPMFMTAGEIMETHQPSDWDRQSAPRPLHEWNQQGTGVETDEEVWSRKASEAHHEDWKENWDTSLHQSIHDEGVRSPVHLSHQFGSQGKPQVMEGHHRVAASASIDPNRLIPVLHHERSSDVGNYIMDYE